MTKQDGPLSEELDMNSPLSPRVAALEVGMRSISNEVESVKTSVDRLSSHVVSGFAEIRRDSANAGKTNWGWIIGGISILVAIVGAIGTAWVRPLQAFDEQMERRIDRIADVVEVENERSIRTDERLRVYRELGVVGLPAVEVRSKD